MSKVFASGNKHCQLKRWYAAYISYRVKDDSDHNEQCQKEFIKTLAMIPWVLDALRELDRNDATDVNPDPCRSDGDYYTRCFFHNHGAEECNTEAE